MIARSKLEVRRPVYESVARDWMGPALHIHRQAGFPDLPKRLFVVAIGDPGAGAAMEVRIVHGHLCEVYASAGQRRECGRMRCKRTPAVGTWPSAARTVFWDGRKEGGLAVRADRRGKGSGPEVPRSGKELSSARAEAKEANISVGSL